MSETINTIFSIEAQAVRIEHVSRQVRMLKEAIDLLPKDGKVRISIEGTTAGTIEKRAAATQKLSTELQRLKTLGPVNVQVSSRARGQVDRLATGTRQLRGELTTLERTALRVGSRLEFLFTAIFAGIAIDVLQRGVADAAALTGRIRNLDIGFTRSGQSGRQFYEILRTTGKEAQRAGDQIDHLRFTAEASSDALAKIMVGGLQVDTSRLTKMKAMSVGAGALFGASPSVMMTDLTTAWLRQSYKLADNLGLVVRRMDAFKKMADELNKKPIDLTANEKAEAFGREMLESTGADLLVLASQIETPLIQLENAKERLDTLKLSYGRVILEGITPTIDRLGDMSDAQLESTARTSMLIAKTTLWLVGLQQASVILGKLRVAGAGFGGTLLAGAAASQWLGHSDKVMAGFGRIRQQYGTFTAGESALLAEQLAMRKSMLLQKQQGVMLARNAALFVSAAAAIALVTAAQDNYNQRMARSKELTADITANGLKYTQFLASIGLAAEQSTGPVNELNAMLAGIKLSGDAQSRLRETVGAMQTYNEELQNNADRMQLSADQAAALKAQVDTLAGAGISAYIAAIREAAIEGGNYGVSLQDVSLIARETFIPAVIDAQRAVEDMQISQIQGLATGLTAWDNFMAGVRSVLLFLVDVVAEAVTKIGALLTLSLGVAVAAAIEAAMFPINAFVSAANAVIGGINGKFHTNFSEIQGLTIPGLHINVGGGVGKTWNTMFGGANADATQQVLDNLFTARGSDNRFGFGLFEQAQVQQAAPAIEALASLTELTRKGGGKLGFLPPDSDLAEGRSGGGSKAKRDDYATAVERLNQTLAEIEARIKYNQHDPEEAAKLATGIDKALVDFLVDADAAGWLERLASDPDLSARVNAAYERYIVPLDELAAEIKKAVDKANENLGQAERENEIRQALGLQVDQSAAAQAALTEYIELAGKYGADVAQQYQGTGLALAGLREAITERREEAAQLRLGYDLDQIGYQGSLAAAREPDKNRRIGIQANTLLDVLDRQMLEAGRILETYGAGSREAYDAAQGLQDLHLEIESLVRGLGHEGLLTGSGKALQESILADVQSRMDALLSQLNAGAYVSEQERLATGLDINTTALGENTAAIRELTIAAGGSVAPDLAGTGATGAADARFQFQLLDSTAQAGGYAALGGIEYPSSAATGTQRIWVVDECTGGS